MLLLHPPVAPWLVRLPQGCQVSLLTDRDDLPRVFLRTLPNNEEQLLPMRRAGHSGALHRWDAFLPWDTGNAVTRYAFKVLDHEGQHWLAADGLYPHVPPEALHFRVNANQRPPDWVRDQVFYQIFPDRFARGGPIADRSGQTVLGSRELPVVQKNWDDAIDFENPANSFWGGDLPGVEQRLPYLHDELGATALYLNPIFAAGSNHRYDTEDYTQVDPFLGGNAALASLCRALRAQGMKLVLDAVVNHTGTNHPWFNRWGRHAALGAAQSAASPYRDFYAFDERGQALGWKRHASLPVLDFSSPALRRAIYEDKDSVLRRWLRPPYAIDGWRLDVIHMLGEGGGAWNNAHYVREFRRAMREENPQSYVLGEHFAEATRWLQGDQEDGAMNYHGFAHPVRAWLARQDLAGQPLALATADFERWLAQARALIPWDNQLAQLNLLDSHDTARLLTLLGGDLARMRLAVTLLFTSPGVPCIYYGDEIGLEGGPDPDCRRPFDWRRERWSLALFEHYRRLVRLRRERAEWRHGAMQTLLVGDDYFVFARYTQAAATIVAVNRGPAVVVEVPLARLPLPALRWRDANGGGSYAGDAPLSIALPAVGSVLLLGEQ